MIARTLPPTPPANLPLPVSPWRRRAATAAIVAPPFLYLLVLFIMPIGGMLVYSFGEKQGVEVSLGLSFEQYRRLFDEPQVQLLLLKSLRIAALVTAICVVVGFATAFVVARFVPRRWQYFVLLLIVVPSWTSFIIRTYSWLLVLGQRGLVNTGLEGVGVIDDPLPLAFNEFAVIVALVYVYLPWAVLPMYVALEKVDERLFEAGRILGAGPFQLLRRVIFPLSLPGVAAASLIVFVPSVSTFAVPVILGGTKGHMYGNLVNSQFLAFNWPFGAALATVMLVVTAALVALGVRFARLGELWTSQ